MTDCIFCRIAAGEIPARIAHQDEHVVAFHDVDPRAPLHVLVIPRRHIASVDELSNTDATLVGQLYLAARQIAAASEHGPGGYRLVMNNGAAAGQSVAHIHLHLLAGRDLGWPPG